MRPMYEFPLLFPERAADATIKGFLYQVLRSVLEWLDVGQDEVLLCEGDEDLDRCLFEGDKLKWTEQNQYKNYLSQNLSARHSAVYESIFYFIMSYEHHHRAGRKCRFNFLTTAGLATQETCDEIPDDVLQLWKRITVDSHNDVKTKLVSNVKGIVQKYRISFFRNRQNTEKELKFNTSIQYIEQNALWEQFVNSVTWHFAEPNEKQLRDKLVAKLRSVPHLSEASDCVISLFATRMEVEVLRKSSHPDSEQRTLTKESLAKLLHSTSHELLAWAHATGLDDLAKEIVAIKAELNSIQSDLAVIKQRLPISLKDATALSLQILAQRTKITFKGIDFSIDRIASNALIEWVLLGSCIVTGEPGIGKSAMMCRTAASLIAKGYTVVVLTVDRFLKQHHLTDELIHWKPAKQGFIFIDGLDAERGERTSLYERLETLSLHSSKWHIVASMRRFDLENDSLIQRLFAGHPHSQYGPTSPWQGTVRARCFEIGKLKDFELDQARARFPVLDKLISHFPGNLLELLRNPFNLSLAAEIASGDTAVQDLPHIKSQVDLLNCFWERRISLDTPQYRPGREAVLRKFCQKLMTIPSLRVPERYLDVHLNWDRLSDLLHAELIVRHNERSLEFADDILFDYAISRYWLAEENTSVDTHKTSNRQDLLAQLEQHGDLVLLIYPSFELYFIRLWEKDVTRQSFWNCVLALAGSGQVSAVLLVAPATVAACLACSERDLFPLHEALRDGSEPAHKTLQRLVSALANLPPEKKEYIRGSPWCSLAAWLAMTKEPRLLDATRRLLWILTPVENQRAAYPATTVPEFILTNDEQDAAYSAAFAYFQHISIAPVHNIRLFETAIQLLCRNVARSPSDVFARLRYLITAEQITMYGYGTVPAIARSLQWLFPFDAEFVTEFVIAAFQHQDSRSDKSIQFGGPVRGLLTNRKQEYDMGLYEIETQFDMLLILDPAKATRALIAILDARNITKRKSQWEFQRALKIQAEGIALPEIAPGTDLYEIQLDSCVIRFQNDYSGMSEGLSDSYEHELKMLNTWSEWLSKAIQNSATGIVETVFSTLLQFNTLEIIWMRLVRVSTVHPSILGTRLVPLVLDPMVFTSPDRQKDVGIFLRQVLPLLSDSQRANVEARFQLFVNNAQPQDVQRAAYFRDKVLSYVHAEAVPLPDVKPPRRGGLRYVSHRTRRQRDTTIVKAQPKLNRCLSRVRRWAEKKDHLSRLPADQLPLHQIRGDLRQLHCALAPSENGISSSTLNEEGWGYLAAVSAQLAQREDVRLHAGLFEQLKLYVLGAAESTSPPPRPDEPLPAGTMMSYGFPSARIHAAVGLCSLFWKSSELDQQIINTLERIALYDVNSTVRWHVTMYAQQIHHYQVPWAERYIEHIAYRETSGAVVANWLKSGVLWKVAHHNLEWAIKILNEIDNRFSFLPIKTEDEAKQTRKNEIHEIVVNYYVSWFVRYSHRCLTKQIDSFLSQPWLEATQLIPHHLYKEVADGLEDLADLEKDNVRQQAWSLITRLCKSAVSHFKELAINNPAAGSEDGHRYIGVQHTLNNLARMTWHHLEVYQQERVRDGDKNVNLGPLSLRTGFFENARPIFTMLATVQIPAIADEVVKALSGAIDFAAKEALMLASISISNAVGLGYATDTFAALTVNKFVRRYLAEQRELLREDKEARDALIRILSLFVDVGWPDMQKLVFRLADTFR